MSLDRTSWLTPSTLLIGGSVCLSSRDGQGSCFHAELPLKPLPGGAAVQQPFADGAHRLQGARVLLVKAITGSCSAL